MADVLHLGAVAAEISGHDRLAGLQLIQQVQLRDFVAAIVFVHIKYVSLFMGFRDDWQFVWELISALSAQKSTQTGGPDAGAPQPGEPDASCHEWLVRLTSMNSAHLP